MLCFIAALIAPPLKKTHTRNISPESPLAVSTISSNHHPALIDMNNNRRKLVNGEHNCPRQKAKRRRSHFTAGAGRRRRLGCSQSAQGGYFTPDIHLAPESHFITGSPTERRGWTPRRCTYSLILSTALFLLLVLPSEGTDV